MIEQVQDLEALDVRIFAETGLYAETLYLKFETDQFSAFGDSLTFGGDSGLGGSGFGGHTLTAQTFFSDTSFLSQSAFTSRGETKESDGGPVEHREL